MICIPIGAADNQTMFELLRQADSEPADILELRLDYLREPPRVEELLAAATKPVIVTCRSWREGGNHSGGDAERRDILLRACRAGAAYVDAEPGDVPHLRERGRTVLIASLHDFEGTPEDLDAKVRELAALPADWVKFAVTPQSTADNLKTLSAIAASPKPCIGMAMGEKGLFTRVLGPAFGSRVTFGSLDSGRETAPGQPTARDLHDLYRVNELSRDTAVYGLLGNPVAQSKGYILHNRAFRQAGVDAVYIPFLIADAGAFLDAAPAALNLRGLSVTIPHKRAALEWASVVSEAASRIGAANTLTLRPDGWHGDNTDCLAVVESLQAAVAAAGMDLRGAPALVLGAGGTTGAVGVALMLLGCAVTVAARDDAKARRLADAMGWQQTDWAGAWRGDWRVVANTTPVGMYPHVDDSPYPAGGWRSGMLAFDAVHNPAMTRFLRDAERAGALTVGGDDMFVRQAAGQFKLWTGKAMPKIEGF